MMRSKSTRRSISLALCLLGLFTPLLAQTGRDLVLRDKAGKSAKEQAEVPHGYALVIGISHYQNLPGSDLKFPVSDAQAIYRVLISAEGGAFPAENVHTLFGEAATLNNIRREVEEWLSAVAKPEDRVVVYFAGHGFVSRGKGYLAAFDTQLDRLEETGYSMQALGNTLNNRVKAKWKALFLDACHSGKINAETSNEQVSSLIETTMAETQFLSLAATLGREKSYEDEKLSTGFGVFSYFLALGIAGGADDDPCDGWVQAGELVEFVRREVQKYAKDRGVIQTPHAGSDFDPAMILGRATKCGTGAKQESRTGSAHVEANLPDTEVWIDETLVGKISPGKPLLVPGLGAGDHTVRGCADGYECEIRKIVIAPGQTVGISVRIRYRRRPNQAAVELMRKGERLLYTQRSTVNPVNMLPVRRSQSKSDLVDAKTLFVRALALDNQYALAAYQLGVTNQLLGDERGSMDAFRRSIEMDPANAQSRVHYAGTLIENGDADEAIRQLTASLQLEENNAEARALLARAYLDKEAWQACVTAADAAIERNSTQETAHLWRGDCERQLAVKEKSASRYRSAAASYLTFLNLTNYSTPVHQWFAHHFIGFHLGGRHHADRKASYDLLRAAGMLGVCICERNLGRALRGREYCLRAIQQDPADPIAHFLLGMAQVDVFNKGGSCRDLDDARRSFQKMLALNGKVAEARSARHYIEEIDSLRPEIKRRGC